MLISIHAHKMMKLFLYGHKKTSQHTRTIYNVTLSRNVLATFACSSHRGHEIKHKLYTAVWNGGTCCDSSWHWHVEYGSSTMYIVLRCHWFRSLLLSRWTNSQDWNSLGLRRMSIEYTCSWVAMACWGEQRGRESACFLFVLYTAYTLYSYILAHCN